VTQQTIAVDGDNVLVDYSVAYANAWKKAFGELPQERDPSAYWPMDRWAVERLTGARLDRFRASFDDQFWATMPAVDGAIEACHLLHEARFRVVCVTALDPQYQAARLRNLRALGFPIDRVVATGAASLGASPKAAALAELGPIAFVDDYLPYFQGVKAGIHRALITRQSTGSPNVGAGLDWVDTQHVDLLAFAKWWLA
jgi:phosphoglycolate phosphatase-like HAD superfamily hydrolase